MSDSPTEVSSPELASPGLLPPFFILGCVRSGTTMLRDILRRHPNLNCPEETHFYRWGEPFGSPGYVVQIHGALLKNHRERDGISDPEFRALLAECRSKAELMNRYMARFLAVSKPGARRWFDKTPQHVYGAALLAHDFPQARFIHIVRNPVEVVASLRIGKVIAIPQLRGACAYWNESIVLINALKQLAPGRVMEMRYEDFTQQKAEFLPRLLQFVGEDYDPALYADFVTEPSSHRDEQVLSEEEVAMVEELCLPGRQQHGYAPEPQAEGWVGRLRGTLGRLTGG